MGGDFEIPGAPYAAGREVVGYFFEARRDLAVGDELTLNYFQVDSHACPFRRYEGLVLQRRLTSISLLFPATRYRVTWRGQLNS